jgi:type IV pilus assembly protein PilN
MLNLLPWRSELYKKRARQFLLFVGLDLLFTIVCIIFWGLLLLRQIKYMESINNTLKQQISVLQKKNLVVKNLQVKCANLERQIKNIQYLSTENKQVIALFNELGQIVSGDLYLSEVTKNDQIITLIGIAKSHDAIEKLIKEINKSLLLKRPLLHELKANNIDEKKFIIECALK